MELLLQRRANPDAVAPRLGLSALILAAQHGRASVARQLLAAGANVDYEPSNPSMLRRYSALFCVALHGCVVVVVAVVAAVVAIFARRPLAYCCRVRVFQRVIADYGVLLLSAMAMQVRRRGARAAGWQGRVRRPQHT